MAEEIYMSAEDQALYDLLGGEPPPGIRRPQGRPATNIKEPVKLTAAQKERARIAAEVKSRREALKEFKNLEGEDDEDLDNPVNPVNPVNPDKINGGKRDGAGAKDKATQDATRAAHILYTKSRAKLEQQKALMAELDFKIKSGEYVPREDVRQATAKAFSNTAQTLRSIPDNIERKLGVDPVVAQDIGEQIDQILNTLATELEEMHKQSKGEEK